MTTFNPSDKSATITLSNGNLTATSSTAVGQGVRSTTSYSTGKIYFEFTMNTSTNDFVVGLSNATEDLGPAGGQGLGYDSNGIGFYPVSPAQQTYISNGPVGNGGASASSNGAVISVAVDFANKKLWVSTAVMRTAGQSWNNSATDNPGTGTGGNSFSAITGPYFAEFNDDVGGAVCTVNFGGAAFNQTVPSGFTAWDSGTSITLTGVVATGSKGSLTANPSGVPAGRVATGLVGTEVANPAAVFQGGAAIGSSGTCGPNVLTTPTGVAANGSAGSFTSAVTVILSGVGGAGSTGSPVAGLGAVVTGCTAASGSGLLSPSSVLPGASVTGVAGVPTGSISATPTGVVGTSAASPPSAAMSSVPSGAASVGQTGGVIDNLGAVPAGANGTGFANLVFAVSPSVTGSSASGLATSTLTSVATTSAAVASGQAASLRELITAAMAGAVGTALGGSSAGVNAFISGVVATGASGHPSISNVIAAAASNIHIGLGTWTAGTYNPGDRVAKSGNAYQCITGGTSVSGPSGTGSNITDNTAHWKWLSAIDFTTAQAWANSIPPGPTALSQPYVGYLWNDGAINLTTGVAFLTLNSHVTSSTNTITLTCAPGESIRDSLASNTLPLGFNAGKGVSITLPSGVGSVNYIGVTDANVIFDGLQFADPLSTSNSTMIQGDAGTTITLRNCIFDGYAQAGGAYMLAGDTLKMSNCLVVDRQGATDGAVAVSSGQAASNAVNCTFVGINNNNGAAFSVTSAAATVKNCIFVGYLNGVGGSGALIQVDHSLFTASNVGFGVDNGNNLFSKTAANQFVSATTDFRLKYSSDALERASTDLTDVPTATDIATHSRPQGSSWDIGAWEFVPLVSGAGVAAVGSVGSVIAQISSSITGLVATGGVGTPTIVAGTSINATISGVEGDGFAAAAVGQVMSTSGSSGFGQAGSITAANQGFAVGGAATGAASSPIALLTPTGNIVAAGICGSLGHTVLSSDTGVQGLGGPGLVQPTVAALSGGVTGTTAAASFSTLNFVGVGATGVAGPVDKEIRVAGSTVVASGFAGSLQLSTIPVAGVEGDSGTGLVSPVEAIVLVGLVGLGLASPTSNAINGVSGLAGSGSLSANILITPAGIVGLGGANPTSNAVNGIAGFGSAGGLVVAVAKALLGSVATGAASPTINTTRGVEGDASCGNLVPIETSTLAGVSGATSAGSTASILQKPLGGVSATSGAGNLATSVVITASIANIHVGLANWQGNHAYSLGNRVANNGSAYQCTSSGTSAAIGGPTGASTPITDGGAVWKYLSPIDFTTVQRWANGLPPAPAALTLPYIGYVWNDGPITTTAGVPVLSLSSHITSPANTITLTPAPGESFRDTLATRNTPFALNAANGVTFVLPSSVGSTNYFDVSDANVIFDGLQFQDPTATSNSTILQNEIGGSNFVVQNCIFDGYAQIGGASMITANDQMIMRNCLVVDRQGAGAAGFAIVVSTAASSIFVNNTQVSVNNNTAGLAIIANASGYIAVCRNNYFIGYATPICGAASAVPVDHCAFSQASLAYANSAVLDSGGNLLSCAAINQFIDPALDFRTKYSSNGLDRAATDITDLPSQGDISTLLRRQGGAWDIGAWELVPLSTGIGVAASGSAGSFATTRGNSLILPSASATGTIGTAAGNVADAPNGITAASFTATLAGTVVRSIVGRDATSQIGVLVAETDGLCAGVIATGSPGILIRSAVIIGISAIGVSGLIRQAGDLLGLSATSQVGSLAEQVNVPQTDALGTGGIGLFTPQANSKLAGTGGTSGTGGLTDTYGPALTGTSSFGQAGSALAGVSATPGGTVAVAAIGIVGIQSPSAQRIAIFGVSGGSQAGSVTATPSAVPLGIVGSGSASTATRTDTITAPSASATGLLGAINANPLATPAGVSGSGGVTTMAVVFSDTATGAPAVGASGTLRGSISKTVSGVAATAAIGSTLGALNPGITGLAGTGSAQSLSDFLTLVASGASANGSVGRATPQIGAVEVGKAGLGGSGAVGSLQMLASPAGASGTGLAGSLAASELVAIIGIAGTVATGALTAADLAKEIGAISIGGTGTLSVSDPIGPAGRSASAFAGSLTGQSAGIIAGAIVRGDCGTLGATVGASVPGTVASGAVSSLLTTSQPIVTGASAVAAGGQIIAQMGLSTSVAAVGQIAALTPTSNPRTAGASGTGIGAPLFGQPITAPIGISGVTSGGSLSGSQLVGASNAAGIGQSASLGALIGGRVNGSSASGTAASLLGQTTTSVIGSAAVGAAGGLLGNAAELLTGGLASGLIGTVAELLQASLVGRSGTASIGSLAAIDSKLVTGIEGDNAVGSVARSTAGVATGLVATVASGTLKEQETSFPSGVVATGSGTIGTQLSATPSGIAAAGAIGGLINLKVSCLPTGCAASGQGSAFVGQTIVSLSGRAGAATCGSLFFVFGPSIVGTSASTLSGTVRLASSTLLPSMASAGAVGVLLAQPGAITRGATCTALAGQVRSLITALPIGVSATGVAGVTYGWLIMFSVTGRLPMVIARVTTTVPVASQDDPDEIDVYAVPQVVQLVYQG